MKFTCPSDTFKRSLTIVNRALGSRTTLPIAQNVLLSVEDSSLKLSATNLQVSLTTWVQVQVERPGEVTVPARLLTDFVNSLPNEVIEMEVLPKTAVLQLTCGTANARIHGTPATEFPPIPTVAEGLAARVDPKVLRRAISRVVMAAATEESRPILTGVAMKLEGKKFTLAAADGFRLAVETASLPEPVETPAVVVIPARTMHELLRLLDHEELVLLRVTPNKSQVMFRANGVEMVSQLLQGDFPHYEQLIPQSYETRTVFDQGALAAACRTAAVFSRDESNIIRVRSANDEDPSKVAISARNEETGETRSEVSIAEQEGGPFKIAFNARYLLDVVGVLDPGQIVLETKSPSSPGVFRAVDAPDYVHVVMPLFVTWEDDAPPEMPPPAAEPEAAAVS